MLNPDDIIGPDPSFFKFDRLGVRIFTIFVKKLFNLNLNLLTKRDAWVGTFESYFSSARGLELIVLRNSQELPSHLDQRKDDALSEFQIDLIQLAPHLVGDHVLNTNPKIVKRDVCGLS